MITLLNKIAKYAEKRLKELERREKISKSVKTYYRNHGATRRVPIKQYGMVTGYIYLDRQKAL